MSRLSNVVRPLTIAGIIYFALAIAFPVSKSTDAIPSVLTSRAEAPCFSSNGDISGIGVRVSTYAQSFLLFFTTLLCVGDGHLDSREREALEKSYINLLITCFALLISAFFKAKTSQLSIYHAILVLDWSWMLTANALILCIIPTIDGQIELKWKNRLRSVLPSRTGQLLPMFFLTIQLSLMGALGFYIWWTPVRFHGPDTASGSMTSPDAERCFRDTFASVFFVKVRASKPALRHASLAWYLIVAIPFFNVFALTAVAVGIVNFINGFIPYDYDFGRLYTITWLVQTVMNVFLAVNAENTISQNKHLLDSSESSWGFGQILAVVLILSPILEALSVVIEKSHGAFKGKVEFWFQRFLRESEEEWQDFYKRARASIGHIIREIQHSEHLLDDTREAVVGALTSAQRILDATNQIFLSSPYARASSPPESRQPTSSSGIVPTPTRNSPVARSSSTPQTVIGQRITQTEDAIAGPSSNTSSPLRRMTTFSEIAPVPDPAPAHVYPPPAQHDDRLKPKKDLDHLWERISKIRELRFPEIRDAKTFLAVKGYLRATREALGAASAALAADTFAPRPAANAAGAN